MEIRQNRESNPGDNPSYNSKARVRSVRECLSGRSRTGAEPTKVEYEGISSSSVHAVTGTS